MDNYLDKLKNDIQILIDSLDQVSSSKITFKNKHKPINIDQKNLISTYLSLGSLWYEFYYSHFIEKSITNQVNKSFKLSEPLYRISQQHNPISINKNWHVEEILDKGNTLLLRKGFRSLFMDRGAVYAEKPYEIVEKYSEINLLDSSGFQFESDDTWIRIYGKIFPRSSDDTVRHYFNVNRNGDSQKILGFLDSVIKEFNENKVVFNLKILGNQNNFLRADCLVIYVEKRSFISSCYILGRLHQEFEDILEDKTPLFTIALDNGWGVAEEPNDVNETSSFGQIRIRQMSDFFINHIVQKSSIPTVEEVLENIKNIHKDEQKYYLNADSKMFVPEISPRNWIKLNEGNPKIEYLKASIKIGNLLGGQAIWTHSEIDRQCLWIRNYRNDKKENKPIASTVCGIKMIGGTIGIAFFYSILYKETGNDYFRFLAQGALNYSVNIFSKRFKEYLKDEPYVRSLYNSYQKINIISSNLNIDLSYFTKDIDARIKTNLDNILKDNDIKNHLGTLLFLLKSKTVKLSEQEKTIIKDKIVIIVETLEDSKLVIAVSILLRIDSIWIDDYKDLILEKINRLMEQYLKSQAFKQLDRDFFENFKEIIFIYVKLKKHFGRSLQSIHEIIDYFKIKWLDAQNQEEKYTFHEGGIFQYFEFLEILSNLFPKMFSSVYVTTLIKTHLDKLDNDFLQCDSFPTFNLGKGIYNPGLYDGVAGVGYIFLRQYNLNLPMLNEAEWKL